MRHGKGALKWNDSLPIMVVMHELGLLTGVVGAVENACSGRNVTKVAMRVGDRAGVVYESLIAAWPVASAGTLCDGAEFEAERIPATVFCPSCNCEREIDEFFALTCPVCGTPTADLRHGKEFEILYVEIDDDAPSAPAAN